MKKIILTVIMCVLLTVAGCGKSEDWKDKPYFHAVVLKVGEKNILVEPLGGAGISSYRRLSVSKDLISDRELPELEEGYEIRVIYDGEIEEAPVAKVKNVYAIYLVDITGEIIE